MSLRSAQQFFKPTEEHTYTTCLPQREINIAVESSWEPDAKAAADKLCLECDCESINIK